MNTKKMILSLFCVACVLGATWVRFRTVDSTTASQKETAQELAPHYFSYSSEKLAELLASDQMVLLYFHAPWCTTCTSFDQELRTHNNALPEHVVVLQIDYDTHASLRQQYQIVQQHTLVLLRKDGTIQESWIGGNVEAIRSYLQKKS